MDVFDEYLSGIVDLDHRLRMTELLEQIHNAYPELGMKVAWNQPMFTDHGTFILGLSFSKKHIAVAPEKEGIDHFSDEIKAAGYNHTANLVQFPWTEEINFDLIKKMIDYNIIDKAKHDKFWR